MNEIKKDIEQLEEAAQQLSKETPTGARLALLLLDNLAELLMYRKTRLIFARDAQFETVIPPKYSPRKRREVRKYFKDKVNFLISETQDINRNEGDVLKIGHELRNETYHKGILRESIILCATKTYFEIVCRLLPRLWTGSYRYSRRGEITDFLTRYGIQKSAIDVDTLTEICDSFLGGRICSVTELTEALSKDLLCRIEETGEGLHYLSSNALQHTSVDDLLKEMQFHQMLATEYDFPQTEEGIRELINTRRDMLPKYRPPVTTIQIERWRQRASDLKSETMPGAAMRKFADLDRELYPIEEMVEEAVFQFDEMINMQVHDR